MPFLPACVLAHTRHPADGHGKEDRLNRLEEMCNLRKTTRMHARRRHQARAGADERRLDGQPRAAAAAARLGAQGQLRWSASHQQ